MNLAKAQIEKDLSQEQQVTNKRMPPMENNRVSVTATIQLVFDGTDELTPQDFLSEIEDRLRSGEYFPHDVIGVIINAITPYI